MRLFVPTALTLWLCGVAQAALAADIGTVALADTGVTGTPPGAVARPLNVGHRVVLNERVRTAPAARAEILFRDRTSLAIGPNTEIALDRFVFDPSAGSGRMALSLTKGALRLIGGAASDSTPAVVTTPTATIGVRGSSALIFTDGQKTTAVFVAGDQMCISARGGSVCTSEFGGILTDDGFQGRAGPQELANLNRSLQVETPTPSTGSATTTPVLGMLDLTPQVAPDAPVVSTRGTRVDDPAALVLQLDDSTATPPTLIETPQAPQEPAPPVDPDPPIIRR